MKVAIFDLETSSLYANSGILLCACIKQYDKPGVKTIRADQFKSWKSGKTDQKDMIVAVTEALAPFDIFVAHNGQFFDKPFLTTMQLMYGLRPDLRFAKFVDPVRLSRNHLRLARNSLGAILDYFDIEDVKTPIRFKYWMEAALDSNTKSLDYIVKHCEKDVVALERVYDRTKSLIKGVDDWGSAK